MDRVNRINHLVNTIMHNDAYNRYRNKFNDIVNARASILNGENARIDAQNIVAGYLVDRDFLQQSDAEKNAIILYQVGLTLNLLRNHPRRGELQNHIENMQNHITDFLNNILIYDDHEIDDDSDNNIYQGSDQGSDNNSYQGSDFGSDYDSDFDDNNNYNAQGGNKRKSKKSKKAKKSKKSKKSKKARKTKKSRK